MAAMGAIFNPPAKMTAAVQAGLFNARKRNKLDTALVNSAIAPAWGTIIFPANPSNNDTITIGGTVITFVTGTPSGAQVKIGGSLGATLTALLVYLAANPIASANVSGGGVSLLVQSVKPADTTVTLAASAATVSGANLVPQQVNARLNANNIPVLP
jgi:hypothetical protein